MRKKVFFIVFMMSYASSPCLAAEEILLKNGDRISGSVIRMEENKLTIKTSYAGEIVIDWQEVANMVSDTDIKVVLADENVIKGKALTTEAGTIRIKAGEVLETAPIALSQVTAINPPDIPAKAVKLSGRANIGFTSSSGNTDSKNGHADVELVARTDSNRFTVGGIYMRSEEEKVVTDSIITGYSKYDHFFNKKWYGYANALFTKDRNQDLNLRSAYGVGVGYQFLETELTNFSVEAGPSYMNEDYDQSPDTNYSAGRWSLNYDRYFLDKTFQLFHFHELFVSLENSADMFLRSKTGVRIPLNKNFLASFQVNFDWDNVPAFDKVRKDTDYIFSFGYQW